MRRLGEYRKDLRLASCNSLYPRNTERRSGDAADYFVKALKSEETAVTAQICVG